MRYSFHFLAATASILVGLSACHAAKTAPAAPAPTEPTAAQVAALRETYGQRLLSQPGFALPENRAALDEALASQNWGYLAQAAQAASNYDDAERLLNWERYQIYRGAGYNVAFLYVRDLWIMGQSYEKVAARGPQYVVEARKLKTSALTYLLYTYALIAVDGERCADPTAPQFHRDQITQSVGEIRQFGMGQSVEQRAQAVNTAISIEKQLSPMRDPDPALCQGGIAEVTEALEAHPERVTTTGPQPGYPGTNVMVPVDPDRPPAYGDRHKWDARQQKVRDGLFDQIGGLVSVSRSKP